MREDTIKKRSKDNHCYIEVVNDVIVKKNKKLKKQKQLSALKSDVGGEITKRIIDEDGLTNLKRIFEKVDYLNFSFHDGFVVTPSQKNKMFYIPFYAWLNCPPGRRHTFISTYRGMEQLSAEDKELIVKIFDCNESEDIIWFSYKDVSGWTNIISGMSVVNFIDKNGEKMCFLYPTHSPFYGRRNLSIEDGKFTIHIRDELDKILNRHK